MPVFAYQGVDARGQRRAGELTAVSRGEALRRLLEDKIQPLTLAAREAGAAEPRGAVVSRSGRAGAELVLGGIRLSRAQIIVFTDELSDFLNSGLQLEPALQLMENREERSPVQKVAQFLREKIRDGTSFSEALKTASPSFGELYGNLVAAGEMSGSLAPLLKRQAAYLIAVQELRARVQLALIYPSILILAGILAIAVFMTVLVPQMTNLFSKTSSKMPLPTYVLIKLGDLAQAYGVFVGGIVVVAVVAFNIFIRQPAGRRWWDEAKLNLPLAGPLLRATFFAQFTQTMANLLVNGLPLLTALKLVGRATGNSFWRTRLDRVNALVGEGASLTRALKSVGHFPPNLLDLVKVGEQTGEMGVTLEKISVRYEKIIQQRIDRIMTLLQPAIIIVIGGLVLLIAWSMLAGIFEAMHGLQGHK